MPATIKARLSKELSLADLSQAWETQRVEVAVPEIVFEPEGREVRILFQDSGRDPSHSKFKKAFEQALGRWHPGIDVEWIDGPG